LAGLLAQQTASAGVPLAVASSTVQAAMLFGAIGESEGFAAGSSTAISPHATALAKGDLKTMLLTKLKITTATLLAPALLGGGVVRLTKQVPAEPPSDQPQAKKTAPTVPPAAEKKPAADVAAQKPAGPPPTAAAGIVKAVNAEQRSITINDKGNELT